MHAIMQRKRRRTPSEILQLISRYRASGLTQTEFVRYEDLCLATLRRYLKLIPAPDSRPVPPGPRFLELEPHSLPSASFTPDLARDGYRISLAGNVKLEIPKGFSRDEVAVLFSLLSGAPSR